MLSRGKLRAEHYSMLGKTDRQYSNRSVLSSDTGIRDKMLSQSKIAPISANVNRFSQKSQKSRHRNDLVSQSMQQTTLKNFSFNAHMRNISRPLKKSIDHNAYDEFPDAMDDMDAK